MHSDVAIEIAYSGEFFVRPLRHHHKAAPRAESTSRDNEHPGRDAPPETFDDDNPPDDPALYELVIDNDSGTYRPRKDLLPVLERFLARPSNLGALGRVRVMDGFDDRLKRWKERRAEEKRAEEKRRAEDARRKEEEQRKKEDAITKRKAAARMAAAQRKAARLAKWEGTIAELQGKAWPVDGRFTEEIVGETFVFRQVDFKCVVLLFESISLTLCADPGASGARTED